MEAKGEVRRIFFDGEGQFWLEMLEDGSRSEGLLQRFEGVTCLLRLSKLNTPYDREYLREMWKKSSSR